jgi:preprotein translocase subunit SecE
MAVLVIEALGVSIHTTMKEKKVTNMFKFIQQSRQEASKIVWPTRRETITTTIMVFVMVTILAIFFLITDSIISFLLRIVLSLSF